MHSLESHGGAAVYDTGRPAPRSHTPDRVLSVTTPTDRVRWGPILAGLCTALTTGLLLSLAALAFGLNQFDPTSTARSFGIGAGIIGAVIWLLAFGVGGYVAARTAALPGRSTGSFNGLMVGLVGIPLLLWGLSSVVGGLLGTAGTAAQVAAPAAGQAADNPAAQAAAQDTAQQAQAAAQQQLAQVNSEQVADAARNTALGALLPLVLGLAAAGAGGALGARTPEDDDGAVQA
ncbi:MAG TPA: hypothetical protein VGW38_21580 [Chloroflexota bacterium]|nr:hypothetical protein [Chloroflexota bacterium]